MARHRKLGVAPFLAEHPGKHREYTTVKSLGLIPLGNRSRDAFAFGENVVEERESLDAYSKFIQRR